MNIDDIKRLPTTYDTKVAGSKPADQVARKDAGNQQHTESVAATGKNPPVSKAAETTSQKQQVNITFAIDKLKDHVKSLDRELQFAVDDETGRTVVTIRDAETQKVLRQIPSEEILELSKSLEQTQGILFKKEA